MTDQFPKSRHGILRGLINASLIILIALALKLLSPDHISPDLARRLLGVLLGAVVMIYANAAPKALSPLIRLRCDPVSEQAVRRFTGWSLTLGGAAYATAWMIAPIESANTIAGCLLGASLLLVAARFVRGGTPNQPPA